MYYFGNWNIQVNKTHKVSATRKTELWFTEMKRQLHIVRGMKAAFSRYPRKPQGYGPVCPSLHPQVLTLPSCSLSFSYNDLFL